MAIEDLMGEGTVLPITRWGTPVMHEQTQPVTAFDDDLRTLVADMFTTMRAAQGVGLAATQVGRGLSLFVYLCPDADDFVHYGAICNPTVTTPTGKERHLDSSDEGCLSFPGGYERLSRPDRATCTGVDPWGEPVTVEGTGLLARCLQHETDHLEGTVFGDRLSARAYRKLAEQVDAVAHLYPDDWPVSPKRRTADS